MKTFAYPSAPMTTSSSPNQGQTFAAELDRRFNDLTTWAIANWPDASYVASEADFAAARKNIDRLRAMHDPSLPQGDAAEPSAGGAQYVDVSPSPWP